MKPSEKRPGHAGRHSASRAPLLGQDNVLWHPCPLRAHSATPRGWPDPSIHIPSPVAREQPKWGRPQVTHTQTRSFNCQLSQPSRDWERRCHRHPLPYLSSRPPVLFPIQGSSRSETLNGVTHGGKLRLTFAMGPGSDALSELPAVFCALTPIWSPTPNTNPLRCPPRHPYFVPWSGDNGGGVSVTSLLELLPSARANKTSL